MYVLKPVFIFFYFMMDFVVMGCDPQEVKVRVVITRQLLFSSFHVPVPSSSSNFQFDSVKVPSLCAIAILGELITFIALYYHIKLQL